MSSVRSNNIPYKKRKIKAEEKALSVPHQPIQIFVTGGEITLTLKAAPSSSILDVKLSIQDSHSIPPSQYFLIFRGKKIEDGKLSDFEVRSGSTLQMCTFFDITPFLERREKEISSMQIHANICINANLRQNKDW
jgi:hypothetical protein